MKAKQLKVLIISTTGFKLDGITNVILNYYRAMDKSDMQIDFVVGNDIFNDLKIELESCGSRIYKIGGRMKKTWAYINRLSSLIQENNYDIVHAHGNSCTLALEMYAAKKGGAKIRIPHSHNSKNKYKVIHLMLRGIFNSTYTHGFACGKMAGEWLYNEKPFKVIKNGINIDEYRYNAEVRERYRKKYNLVGKKVIGHVGHFTYQKNHDYLLDIFVELYQLDSNYRLLLIGDGELKPAIEKRVSKLGLSDFVIFAGKTLETPQLMQAMDIVVMPSRFEGLPLTLVEAQTASLSCYVSDAISKEAGITGLVKFIELDNSPKEWASIIEKNEKTNREEVKEIIVKEIIESGYSIVESAQEMKKLYKSYFLQGKN
ncbi:glycosyltransferase family 1 protein [Peribacillus simplex]|uniref:glycosyltransferase family 1 protein n=1 Tax=Peribacillus simplex TaxID=1478 RepID=UPI0016295212|nr:glycosyltransferase family 1 protein [Peribacillus simplex]